ncbi:MAG: serine/threonine-protein kinase [Deltaproteobacteria bacterium]
MTTPSDSTWHRVDALLSRALELDPDERADLLDEVRAESPDDAALLSRLIDAAEEDGVADRPALDDEAPSLVEGALVGAWRIVRTVGAGGMGEVFEAQRDDGQYDQRVALKVLRTGARGARRRFLAERRFLASLDHPAITRIVDGGVLDNGRPYFVMSFVEGEPLDVWLERARPPLRRRLELFVRIANAVHYAHQRLVVHRDLKPSNILVTENEAPVLLDFGVARALDEEDGTHTFDAFTPAWAAPEQLEGRAATTATDVYGLGLVLFKLLTGTRPFERAEPRATPPVPSARGAHAAQGELDAIVAFALAVDPNDRYPSAEALADDVERHLEDRTIRAPGASWSARALKAVRRQRWPLALAATIAIAVVGYTVTLQRQAEELRQREASRRRSAERADRIADFMVSLLASANPEHGEVTVVDLVDDGTRRLTEDLSDWPEVHRAIATALGDAELALGRHDAADALLQGAIDSFEEAPPADREGVKTWTKALLALSRVRRRQGKIEEADDLAERARRVVDGSPDPILGADVDMWIATLTSERFRHEDARKLYERAYDARREHLGETAPETILAALRVAEMYSWLRRDEPRDAWRDRAVAALERSEAPPRRRIDCWIILVKLDKVRAEHWRTRALEALVDVYGRYHPAVADALNDFALGLEATDTKRAVAYLERALEVIEAHYGATTPRVERALSNLGAVLRDADDLDAAEPYLVRALALSREVYPPKSPRRAYSLTHLAQLRHRQGRLDEAAALSAELVTLLEAHPKLHFFRGVAAYRYAKVLRDQQDFVAADTHLAAALPELAEEKRPPFAAAALAWADLRATRRTGPLADVGPYLDAALERSEDDAEKTRLRTWLEKIATQ